MCVRKFCMRYNLNKKLIRYFSSYIKKVSDGNYTFLVDCIYINAHKRMNINAGHVEERHLP